MKKKLAKLMHRSPNLIIDIENIYGRIDEQPKRKWTSMCTTHTCREIRSSYICSQVVQH